MADLKISELVPATTVSETDSFVVVQSGETRKITPVVLFSKIPVRPICKETAEHLSNGLISTNILTTVIDSSVYTNQVFTLAVGVHGFTKEIVCHNLINTFSATVTVTGGRGFSTIVFTEIGQTASLKYITDSWYIMSHKGVTIA